ncbi:MAG: hypothetical protein NVSMB38_17100 [Ktedonobacteraceae bacterium]
MHNSICIALYTQSYQGLNRSIVALDFYKQSFTEDIPQAQGISVPIFGENCLDTPLT